MDFWTIIFSDEDHHFCEFKTRSIGTGHSKTGKRRKWTKCHYFEQDLLSLFQTTLDSHTFAATFAGYAPAEIIWFFDKIKQIALRPRETEWHCRNKFLMWLDKMHNKLSYLQIRGKYCMLAKEI